MTNLLNQPDKTIAPGGRVSVGTPDATPPDLDTLPQIHTGTPSEISAHIPPGSVSSNGSVVPQDTRENAIYRAKMLEGVEGSDLLKSELLTLCSRDIVWTFNAFFMTFDPRRNVSSIPFALWPYQAEFIRNLEERYQHKRDLLVEKSRDMGVTWLVLCWLFWHWRFEPGFQAIIGSRLEPLIDKKGDMATHFERLRWIAKHLPDWWMPEGFDLEKHSPFMQLINPQGGAAIVGQSVTDNFSRQGRYNVAVVDEFAFCDCAENAWRAMADSAPIRLIVSSADGLGNKFAALRRSGTIEVDSLHWSLHPLKAKDMSCQTHSSRITNGSHSFPKCKLTSPWYEGERLRRSPREVSSELDIDYLASGNPYFQLDALEKQQAVKPAFKGVFVELDHKVEFRPHPHGTWDIWELPDPRFSYSIGADPAEGVGGDKSAAVIRSTKDRNMVASLVGQIPPDELAVELERAGRFYHMARILCEREGPGYAVNLDLIKRYGNIYFEQVFDKTNPKTQNTKRFGWSTNPRTRPIMLTNMSEEIRTVACQLKDIRLIEECRTFVWHEAKKKAMADSGYNDDYIFAWAIAGMGLVNIPRFRKPKRRLVPKMRRSATSLV